jgi:TrmH family RNA methyltransferase
VADDFVDDEARGFAYGAWDVLAGARHCATLQEALADCHLVVATSGRSGGEVTHTPRRLAIEADALVGDGRMAIVFGPESTGLTTEELQLCHLEVRIPSHPAQPSLNLAQAVLLIAYEMYLQHGDAVMSAAAAAVGAWATFAQAEDALADLKESLLLAGFLNTQNPEPILSELRALLAKARPTEREITLIRGIARQMRWLARKERS